MNRRKPIQTKTPKDYIVPVAWVLVLLVIIFSFVLWGGDKNPTDNTEQPVDVPSLNLMIPSTVEAYVIYPNDKKVQLTEISEIFEWERLYVTSWRLTITSPSINVNSNTELKFNKIWDYTLMAWDVFVKNTNKATYEMWFGDVVLAPGSVAALSQNTISSQVSILKWTWVMTLSSWEVLDINPGQKAVAYSTDSASTATNTVSEIEDYEYEDEWFAYNNAKSYTEEDTKTSEEDSQTNKDSLEANASKKLVSFDIEDESSIESEKALISGDILSNEVSKVTLNEVTADINMTNWTFSKEISLPLESNDLVYKIYDKDWILLQKGLYTIYNTNASKWTADKWTIASASDSLETYPIIKGFGFSTPNPANIDTTFYTIRWFVPAWVVDKIVVNDFTLKQFPSGWTTWRYHADETYDLLKKWSNIYKVEYYDKEWKIITTSLYIINNWAEELEKISDEAE